MTNTNGRTFGIEIETVGLSCEAAAIALNRAGIVTNTSSYSGRGYSNWAAKPDGSLSSPNGRSAEIVSPVLTWGDVDHYAQVETVCRTLREAGARVNASCGLHVHFGAGDLTRQEVWGIVKAYTAAQYSIDQIVSPSRVNGQWAMRYLDWNAQASAWRDWQSMWIDRGRSPGGRYMTVNLTPYLDRGTVEFRQRNGSLNARKILTWAGLMASIVKVGAETEGRDDWRAYTTAGSDAGGVWDFLARYDSIDPHALVWRDGARPVVSADTRSFSRLLGLQGV